MQATSVLVSDGTTTYAQDLAAPLSQVLNDGTANYVYGQERLRTLGGPWYVGDALGSVRQTLDDAGGVLGSVQYDPWGVPTAGTPQPFGFTGELHSAGQVYLRARWYAPGNGTFTSRDPFAGWATRPYSLHAYQYAYSDPVRWTDPSGRCVPYIEAGCVPFWEADTYTGWKDFRAYSADVVQGMGLPGAMAVDLVTGVTPLEDTHGSQQIMQTAGVGTYLGGVASVLVPTSAAWASWRGGGTMILPYATARSLNSAFVVRVASGAVVGSGLEYATQVSGNRANGLSGRAAWIDAVDGRRVAWWALPGAAASWGITMRPYAALLYGGTNVTGYTAYSLFGGFDWGEFRVALATGLFGGGFAPWMAPTRWGAGAHGGLLNFTQYGLQQSLDCRDLEWLNAILAIGTGFTVGFAGGAHEPLYAFVNPVRPFRHNQSIAAENMRRAAEALQRYQTNLNYRLTIASFIRGTMGAGTTNTDLSPAAAWWNNLFLQDAPMYQP